MKKLVWVLIVFFLVGCSTTKIVEVPVETIKKEYIHDTKLDSIIVRDSVDRWLKGDTLYIYKERVKYKYVIKTDTICKTDSIPTIVTVTKEVKINHIKWYQKFLMWIGVISLWSLIILIAYKLKTK